ncbi:MAG: hypothetical protein JW715_05715 [Sedimentisphaerales bacterium]|nr:hypothetical protein [Sedimentisphaerales bacterium]
MKLASKNKGFSLTEVLLAVGTLAIGMTFVSGTFLAGVYLSTISTERTIASVVADEAFAKVRLFDIDPTDPNLTTDGLIRYEMLNAEITSGEFAYPSTQTDYDKQYFWSALCRSAYPGSENRLVQVTVLISRRVGNNPTYPGGGNIPTPVEVGVSLGAGAEGNKLVINNSNQWAYINDGYKIVDNRTGGIYRVLQRDPDSPNTIVLDRTWQGQSADSVWVVPPPVNGGRNPVVAVYQKLIRF